MRPVKPYYISGYKNRVFNGFKSIIGILPTQTQSYKILPFLPVFLYVAYPFFSLYRSPLFNLISLTFISVLFWWFCIYDFDFKKLLRESYDGSGFINSVGAFLMSLLILGLCMGAFFFAVFVIEGILEKFLPIGIKAPIGYYFIILPPALVASWVTLKIWKYNRRAKK